MRFLHTSDLHIGKTVCGRSMLESQRFFLTRLTDCAVEKKADAILIAGDLYDRSVPAADAVAVLDEFFTRTVLGCGIPVLAISGNHDSKERLSFSSAFLHQQRLYLQGTLTRPVTQATLTDRFGAVNVYLLPYFDPYDARALFPERKIKTFQDAFSAFSDEMKARLDPKARNVLLAHGFFANLGRDGGDHPLFSESEVSVGGGDLMDLSICADCFDYIALGHLHAPQALKRDAIRYSGAPLKYAVGEADSARTVVCVDLKEKGSVSVEPIALPVLRDLSVISGSFQALLSPNKTKSENKAQAGAVLAEADDSRRRMREDYVYVRLTDESPVLGAMERLREIYPNILGLEYPNISFSGKAAGHTAQEMQATSPEDLFDAFYTLAAGVPLTDAERAFVEETFRAAGNEEATAL